MSNTNSGVDLIKTELANLINVTKTSLADIKTFALAEVWKILQLFTVAAIRLIENFGNELSGPKKKALALEAIGNFYDTIFLYIDVPWIPAPIESILRGYIKSVLMMLVGSAIDAMVTTFRQVGVFKPKSEATAASLSYNTIVDDYIESLKKIKEQLK
jgi:hypothetical protein